MDNTTKTVTPYIGNVTGAQMDRSEQSESQEEEPKGGVVLEVLLRREPGSSRRTSEKEASWDSSLICSSFRLWAILCGAQTHHP